MKILKMLLINIVALCCVGFTMGYPSGAPPEACEDMIPQHGVPPQDTPSPFLVSVSPNKIEPKGIVTVRISTNYADDYFEGFFVQARDSTNTAVGKFEENEHYKIIDCPAEESGAQNAATHEAEVHNTSKELFWIAPDTPTNVNITLTLVHNKLTFWAGIKVPVNMD